MGKRLMSKSNRGECIHFCMSIFPQKLKVIGQQQQITCQKQQKNGRIVCKENGTPVNREADSDAVHFNNAQQTDVTVHLGGISVRFNGRKAWLKVSSMYKNSQCGLCGHYDESADDENEWRMGNNQKGEGHFLFACFGTSKHAVLICSRRFGSISSLLHSEGRKSI